MLSNLNKGLALALAVAALVITVHFSRYVRRVDRLDAEVQRTGAALDAQLHVRAIRTLDLAHSARMDPATATLLADIARRALELAEEEDVSIAERAATESALSDSLRVLLPAATEELEDVPGGAELTARLDRAWGRVQVARQLYNSRVAQAGAIRSRYPAALTRLLGLTAAPEPFEMDDERPVAGEPV